MNVKSFTKIGETFARNVEDERGEAMVKLDDLEPGDRKEIDRFARFLELWTAAPRNAAGKRIVSDQTWRYLQGEDVDPTPLQSVVGPEITVALGGPPQVGLP